MKPTADNTYPRLFEVAYQYILEVEGGYVNDVDDPGGETRYGISKRSHPDIDISSLTKEQARDIYYSDYWLPQCSGLPDPIALLMFDSVVNHNPLTAAKMLQFALHVTADGLVGPKTRAAATKANTQLVIEDVLSRRADLYHNLATANARQGKYTRGWYSRLFKLHRFILEQCFLTTPEES